MQLAEFLNHRADRLVGQMISDADLLRLQVQTLPGGVRWIDCGNRSWGGLEAGLLLARICLADLAEVQLLPGTIADVPCPQIQVRSDHPVLACLGSQYAGWALSHSNFFAMTSGPIRATLATEEIYKKISSVPVPVTVGPKPSVAHRQPDCAIGVLETAGTPGDDLSNYLASRLKLPAQQITLLAARSASLCGTMQVVARSLETAIHKLEVLGFDLSQIQSGLGTAPLPPVARKDLGAMGRMNDAILYGGDVVLWVRSDDAVLEELGPKIPSSASPDHGVPFGEIFQRAGQDFYKIDKMLFSPARITLQNLTSGRTFTYGRIEPKILVKSFFESAQEKQP